MCLFITLVFPCETDLDEVRSVVSDKVRRALVLALTPIENPTLRRQLQVNDICVLRGGGGIECDCGTALGARRRSATDQEQDNGSVKTSIARKADKLQRAGWSAVKVEKWLEQKESTARKHAKPIEEPAIEHWATFLGRVLDSGAARRVGLLLHWYNGSLGDEEIILARQEKHKRKEITAEFLSLIEEDVLYEFRRA
jgi:hypothetical protein